MGSSPFPLFTALLLLTSPPLQSFFLLESPTPLPPCEPGRSWAVQLSHNSEPHEDSLDELAKRVALEAGLESHGQIGQLHGHYLLCQVTDEEEHPAAARQTLDDHPHVVWHSQENILRRSKRSLIFNDPKYPSQWHLVSSCREV